MRPRILALLAALLFAGLVAVGCGGDDDSSTDTTTAAAVPADEGDAPGDAKIATGGGVFDPRAVYERAAPGVVTIISTFNGNSDNPLLGGNGGAGQGSGFVISDDGEIVTNAHVVTDGDAVPPGEQPTGEIRAADEVFVQFPDRNSVPAEIVGFDPFSDVALIKVDPDGLDLQPVDLGSIDDIEVGDPVAAIGSPFGERQSLSVGVVSQTDRTIPSLTQFQIDGALQTDASINPGNSGGPLLDAQAKVVGINQQIDTTSGGNQGVGFAVPIDLVTRSIEQLRDDGEVEYAYIGVTTQPLYPQLADKLDIDSDTGALVATVVPDGPADKAGICCELSDAEQDDKSVEFQASSVVTGGDVIVSANGEDIVTETDLPRIISRLDPGDDVEIGLIRDGEKMTVTVTLGTRPESL